MSYAINSKVLFLGSKVIHFEQFKSYIVSMFYPPTYGEQCMAPFSLGC